MFDLDSIKNRRLQNILAISEENMRLIEKLLTFSNLFFFFSFLLHVYWHKFNTKKIKKKEHENILFIHNFYCMIMLMLLLIPYAHVAVVIPIDL